MFRLAALVSATMMRLIIAFVVSVTVVAGASATASATEVGSSRNFGLGFQLGDPTAIIGKAFIGGGNAIDFGLGFGGLGYNYCRRPNRDRYNCDGYGHDFSLHGDFLWQDNLVRQQAKLDWHIGAGARLIFWDTFNGGALDFIARMPVGLDLTFQRPAFLEVFFEVAPGIVLVPFAWFDLDAAIGVRFYF
jgi:hypothetical protein